PLEKGEQVIRKSRYGTIDSFISSCDWLKEEYNDSPLEINKDCYDRLKDAGIDELMTRHIAHLFIRDPLVVYSDLIEMDDATSVHHFETIQSTNWHNVRFKPPSNPNTGWRVEFRPLEIQLTDFENAAFAIFVTLLSRAILFFGLNLYIPISKLDENMQRAHKRNAVRNEKFYWRTCNKRDGELAMAELTIKEIFCGSKETGCLGLVTIVEEYVKSIQLDDETGNKIAEYIALIKNRANGKLLTTAEYLRNFVNNHPLYKFDSNVSESIARDIIDLVVGIAHGTVKVRPFFSFFFPFHYKKVWRSL
ncbi:glutamate-cysteine ligase Gcs1, partial [Reticulomyxa filosa]